MISYLKGTILKKGSGFLILLVNDVGYKVSVNPVWHADLKVAQPLEMYIHHHIREEASDLYGFRSMEELEFFDLIISVSGIGPKTGLGVLTLGDVSEIKSSIANGDTDFITKVSGIGKKTAERVVLELRDKMANLAKRDGVDTSAPGSFGSSDEIDALMALGYSVQQAREALKQVDPKIKDSSSRIREVLRNMSK